MNSNNVNFNNDEFEDIFSNNEVPSNNNDDEEFEVLEILDSEETKEALEKYKMGTEVNNDSVMIVDDRVKDIPARKENTVPELDNGILILDERIKNIKPNHKKNSSFFKHPTIIFPVIAFVLVSILGMYLFVNVSMAESINLIKVEENGKVGYIDSDGTVITRCKYIQGSDYYKGLAVVKNNNNLYGVLNSKGVLEVAFGNYYYIGLFNDRYIASKITNKGLKQALLNYKLDNITNFSYDTISYTNNGVYLFTRDETMGILNKDGKEIYTFEVDEIDDKNIDIEVSKINDKNYTGDMYAKIKINNSSTIVNINTGDVVFQYTLSDIKVLDNNVFYIKGETADDNSTYIVINNDKVKLKTSKYKRVVVDDINSNIALGIKGDTKVDYISLDDQNIINNNDVDDYYYGSGLILIKTHDFDLNKDVYKIIENGKEIGKFTEYEPVNNIFSNDVLSVKVNGRFNYVTKNGKLVSDKLYSKVEDFNRNGYGIVINDDKYGVINNIGNEVVKLTLNKVEQIDEDLFDLMNNNYNKQVFLIKDSNNKYGLVSADNRVLLDPKYDSIEYISKDYPIVLGLSLNEKKLYNIDTLKELPIKVESSNIELKDNYIIIDSNYYNYSGKLIYSRK